MGRPQKSVVYAANATALGDMAQPLRDAADRMLESSDRVRNTVYDFEWEGEAKDAAEGRVDRELVQDRAVGTAQHALADAYENGAKTMQPMIDSLKSKGQGLEADSFKVSEDWVVTDTYNYAAGKFLLRLMGATEEQADNALNPIKTQRANTAATETTNLQRLADELGVADENTTKAINEAKAALADAVPQAHIVLVDDVHREPTINGPGSDPQLEQEEYDLGATIPNHPEVLLPGDPDTARNSLTFPDDGRPIPTGTAVGPDGKQHGFFSDAQGDTYTSAQSTVVDLANPSQSIGNLKDSAGTNIGQASGVYDPATNTMWIVGNVNGTGGRGMWQSAPIDKGNPNGWVSTLQPRGTFATDSAMNGGRENQIVTPPQGGFFLAGSADRQDVVGATASTPEGLLTAPTQPMVGLIPSPDPGQDPGWAYGPSIIGTQVLPNGQEQVTMRVSTSPNRRSGRNGGYVDGLPVSHNFPAHYGWNLWITPASAPSS